MTPTDLAQMLDMLAAALRTLPAGGAAVAPAAAMPLPVAQRTLSDWLTLHEQQILAKGYKRQTVRNRAASIKHLHRLWGTRPITALRAPQK